MEDQLLDKIEKYLNGALSEAEEKAFDTEIEKDPELAAAVDNFGVANDAIELLIEDNLRAELDNLRAEESQGGATNVVSINKNKPVAKMRSLRTYLAAAASVAILLGFFGMNWVGNNYSNSALSEGIYDGFDMPNVRSGSNTLHPFSEGITAYNSGDYTKAIPFFQGIVVDDPRYAEAQFYLGHTLLNNEDFSGAANQFKKIQTLNDPRYTENAEWYQVVAQLSAEETNDEFHTLLNKIVNDENHTFNSQAVVLQNKLNSFWRKLVF